MLFPDLLGDKKVNLHLLAEKPKNKRLKYTSDNLFVARTFRSKVKTMSFTLGTLTLLITLTLVSLNMSSLFKGMFDYQIELAAPYDINIHDYLKKRYPFLSFPIIYYKY